LARHPDCPDSYHEISTYWTGLDIAEWHMALDLFDAVKEQNRKEQKSKWQ